MALTEIGARLSLTGGRRFGAEADRAARSVRGIGTSADRAGRELTGLERRAARAGSAVGGVLGRGVGSAARGIGAATRNVGGLTASLGKAGLVGAVAGTALVVPMLGKSLLDTATQLEGLDQKARTVFGTALPGVTTWAGKSAAKMGLSAAQATGLAAGMGDLLVPMGFARDRAAQMSTETLSLAGALSQWSGGQYAAADVAGLLTDAMLGETDGLKGLGIALSADDVAARLAAKGQSKLTGAALLQAQAVATQQLILEKSTDAQAAYEKGGLRLAGVQARLSAKFQTVREQLATRAAPGLLRGLEGFEKRLPAIQTAVGNFTRAALPGLKQGLRDFGDSLGRIGTKLGGLTPTSGKAQGTGKAIGDLLGGLVRFAGKAAEMWAEVQEGLARFVAGALQVVGDAASSLGDALLDASKWSPIYRDQLRDAGTGLQSLADATTGLGTSLDDLLSPRSLDVSVKLRGAEAVTGLLATTARGGRSGASTSSQPRNVAGYLAGLAGPAVRPKPAASVTRKATGGPARAGQPYIVGEREPELFIPSSNGDILNQRQQRTRQPELVAAAAGSVGPAPTIVHEHHHYLDGKPIYANVKTRVRSEAARR